MKREGFKTRKFVAAAHLAIARFEIPYFIKESLLHRNYGCYKFFRDQFAPHVEVDRLAEEFLSMKQTTETVA
ncbi:hypothetical protein OSB04_028500 [Centaurea solstitialis]|uniref:Uncharacterized protein n=1 Tax=Centaurea solstitialis TaxID=347529 RepID=A0AA38SFP1_9ASTR|nr:hypothetical protein OSB04_028500 [Centaurea solstitialis]